jgi:spore maturation protein CgeB
VGVLMLLVISAGKKHWGQNKKTYWQMSMAAYQIQRDLNSIGNEKPQLHTSVGSFLARHSFGKTSLTFCNKIQKSQLDHHFNTKLHTYETVPFHAS